MGPALIDDIDEAALLAIVPKPFTLPESEARRTRTKQFLADYRPQEPARTSRLSSGRSSLLPRSKRS